MRLLARHLPKKAERLDVRAEFAFAGPAVSSDAHDVTSVMVFVGDGAGVFRLQISVAASSRCRPPGPSDRQLRLRARVLSLEREVRGLFCVQRLRTLLKTRPPVAFIFADHSMELRRWVTVQAGRGRS